jgi:hypothetical protein
MPPSDHGPPDRHMAALVIVVLITGAIVATCTAPTRAQDGHAENHDWYQVSIPRTSAELA